MKPITDILREVRRGRAVEIATEKLAEVVSAVDATGKPGKLTIEITVKPENGGGPQKTLLVKVTHKLPVADDIPEAIFFSDSDGGLQREDPDKGPMFDLAPKADPGPGIPSGMARA